LSVVVARISSICSSYRDVIVSPDGLRVYLTTDNFGTTASAEGPRTSRLGHPGSVLEFTYSGRPGGQ
jgi:hypothetical protein